jgi:predicted transcriptional regulator
MARAKPKLSRREQEIIDIVYAHGHATAADVRDAMADAPTDAAVRTTLRILVAKGHLRIEQAGPRYDYWPTVPRDTARRSRTSSTRSLADRPRAPSRPCSTSSRGSWTTRPGGG